jgi:hypothetical protein
MGVATTPGPALLEAQADRFIEAINYSSFAEAARRCDGIPEGKSAVSEALKWTSDALSAATKVDTAEAGRRERLEIFLKNETAIQQDLLTWSRAQRQIPRELDYDLAHGKLVTAEALFPSTPPPACEKQLTEAVARVKDARQKFDELVREGDSLSGRAAVAKYREAQQTNREDTELARKIKRAGRNK